MEELRYLIVEGLVKSGKTKLSEILAATLNSKLLLDNIDNPFLEDFFKAVEQKDNSLALKTQLIFLLNRFSQQKEINQKGLFQKSTISDYIFFRDGIYAHITLDDENLKIYKKIFNIFAESIIRPDLVVYLQISFAEMIRRIKDSGTPAERQIPVDYWREVFEAYNYYFFNYSSSPLLVVNMEKIDLNDQNDVDSLVNEIKNHKKGTKYYAPA